MQLVQWNRILVKNWLKRIDPFLPEAVEFMRKDYIVKTHSHIETQAAIGNRDLSYGKQRFSHYKTEVGQIIVLGLSKIIGNCISSFVYAYRIGFCPPIALTCLDILHKNSKVNLMEIFHKIEHHYSSVISVSECIRTFSG